MAPVIEIFPDGEIIVSKSAEAEESVKKEDPDHYYDVPVPQLQIVEIDNYPAESIKNLDRNCTVARDLARKAVELTRKILPS